jgi:hypothetical protein
MNIGSLVTPANYHGEPVRATFTLGMGIVRELFIDPIDGEGKAAVEFSDCWGIWPVECLNVIKRESVKVSMIDPPRRNDDDQPTPEGF